MEISNGLAAAFGVEDMYDGIVVGDAADLVCENLIEYCRMDTLAMVKIVERLQALVG